MAEDEHGEEDDAEPSNKEVKIEEKLPDLFEGGTMRGYQMDGFRWLVVSV